MKGARIALAATALGATGAVAGCGGGPDAATVLARTADRLGEVRSADLDLRLLASPADSRRGIGFELTGPFSLGGRDPLPVARLRYTRVLGSRRPSGVLTSTGREAFVTVDGKTTPLDAAAVNGLRRTGRPAEDRSLSDLGLRVEDWFQEAKVEAGPEVDGEATDRVTGRLRTGVAIRDVLQALRRAGAEAPAAGAGLVRRVDELARSSTAEVVTGRKDRILRRLSIRVDLRPSGELDAAVPGAGAVRVTASLRLRRPNRPVEVARPD